MVRRSLILLVALAAYTTPAFAYLDGNETEAAIVAAWKAEGNGRLDGLKAELNPFVVNSGFSTMIQSYQVFIKGSAPLEDRELVVRIVKRVVEPMMKKADGFDPDRLEVNESEARYKK
jgi:hypothetical protein